MQKPLLEKSKCLTSAAKRVLPTKACPIVLRTRNTEIQILAFEHPLAGLQLVKGTIAPGEVPRDAAVRELFEESGLQASNVSADMGVWHAGHQGQIWSFHLCHVLGDVPDKWVHRAADDGGHIFRFFWHTLEREPTSNCYSVFRGALDFVREYVAHQPIKQAP